MNERLPGRWTERDFPLLMTVARHLDSGAHVIQISTLVDELDVELPDALRSARALLGSYLTGKSVDSMAGPMDATITDLTERGRRATGLWPSGESTEALIEALRQAEDATDDTEEKSNLRRAASHVGTACLGHDGGPGLGASCPATPNSNAPSQHRSSRRSM